MKTAHSYSINKQKPIKYKQFVQQLLNSSRSSNANDQSMLSQRSFRQSHHDSKTNRQKKQTNIKILDQSLQKPEKQGQKFKSSRLVKQKLMNGKQNIKSKDKLYTFCDAVNKNFHESNIDSNNSNIQNNPFQSNRERKKSKTNLQKKYFKNDKKLKQLESIISPRLEISSRQNSKTTDLSEQPTKDQPQLIQSIKSQQRKEGFQGKYLKTQSELIEDTVTKNLNTVQEQNSAFNDSTAHITSSDYKIEGMRKIEGVKKVFISSSNGKSYRSSHKKNSDKKQFESSEKKSSKKKIISLNINQLKTHNPQNKKKLKLSLQNSYNCSNDSRDQSFRINNLNNSIDYRIGKMLNGSLDKMSSLEQSKIQTCSSQGNFLLNNSQMREFSTLFMKDKNGAQSKQKDKQTTQLLALIDQLKLNEKKLKAEINEMKQHFKTQKNQQKRQLQILRKDCLRLNNSYRQLKKAYQATQQDKQQLQQRIQGLQQQNGDLKQCLDFKSQQLREIQVNMNEKDLKIIQLQEKNRQSLSFSTNIQGLSLMIRQKIQSYESQISALIDENEKLNLIKQKLQNYNLTLKEQIQQKDEQIIQFQEKIKNLQIKNSPSINRKISRNHPEISGFGHQNDMLNSVRTTSRHISPRKNYYSTNNSIQKGQFYHQNKQRGSIELSLTMIKQLENKLKQANLHNSCIQKELNCLKSQRTSVNKNYRYKGSKQPNSSHFFTTITTRNSSICNVRDTLMNYQSNQNEQDI